MHGKLIGTVFRLESSAWSIVKLLRQPTTEYAPLHPPSPSPLLELLPAASSIPAGAAARGQDANETAALLPCRALSPGEPHQKQAKSQTARNSV